MTSPYAGRYSHKEPIYVNTCLIHVQVYYKCQTVQSVQTVWHFSTRTELLLCSTDLYFPVTINSLTENGNPASISVTITLLNIWLLNLVLVQHPEWNQILQHVVVMIGYVGVENEL